MGQKYTSISDLYKQVKLNEREIIERKLTSQELEDRERIAKKLPMADFKKRYGKDAMAVKMAVATNMAKAKNETIEDELGEKYNLYHSTFSGAMQHAYDYAKKKMGITVDPKEIDSKVATGPKKPTEGKTNKYRLKGKGGNLQIQVYNKGGSKPFELNMYKEENDMTKSLKDTIVEMWTDSITEKVEYVEYKFKNEKDAKAAKAYFDGIQLMSFDVNDDNVRGGELMVDAGSKDMTKYHKEVMKKFRPKVMTQEKKDLTKEKKDDTKKMTDTGKEVTPVETSVKMPKIKETKNKV